MKQLSYGEFQEALKNEIDSLLSQDTIYETELIPVEKNNVSLTGLTIRKAGEAMAPNFYLEPYYEQYQAGKSTEEIGENIAILYEQIAAPDFMLREITSYAEVKEHLEIRLVSKENNKAYLTKGLYRLNEVGAEVVYINLGKSEEGQASVRVTKELMRQYNISPEVLFSQAYQNTVEQHPLEIKTMHEVMQEIMGAEMEQFLGEIPADEPQMYVVSNTQRMNGATVLMYPDALKKIAERVGGEYYLLPSSTHEILAIPKNQAPTPNELRQMVREINRDQVEPTERLSNEVFLYEAKENQLHKCTIKERGMER